MAREFSSHFETLPKNISKDLRLKFREFQIRNPSMKITIDDATWNYILCGCGKESILFLTRGSNIQNSWFFHILGLENDYRCIAVDYPPVSDIKSLTRGIVTIFDIEGIDKAHIIGQSFGGIIGLCLARDYPLKVEKMVLSYTAANMKGSDRIEREELSKALKKCVRIMKSVPEQEFRRIVLKRIKEHFIHLNDKDFRFLQDLLSDLMKYRTKKELVVSTLVTIIDCMRNYSLSQEDFTNWTGKVYIFESESDKAITSEKRSALKSLFKNAIVHTFESGGTSQSALSSRFEEFLSLAKEFFQEKEKITIGTLDIGGSVF